MLNHYINFVAPGKVVPVEEELYVPEDRQGMVLVRNVLTLISPGTELAFFEGIHTDLQNGKRRYPVTPGYSAVGIVEDVTPGATAKVGDRVFCMCSHCAYKWTRDFLPISGDLAWEKAVFAMLGSIALHGVRECGLTIGRKVLVSGLGAIGQIALRFARTAGALSVAGADVFDFRGEKAVQGGCDHFLRADDPVFNEKALAATSGTGFDVVIECSGNTKALVNAVKLLAPRGKLVILGCPHGVTEMDFYQEVQKKELQICGSYNPCCPDQPSLYYPWDKKRNQELVMEYQLNGRMDLSQLITHRGTVEHAQEFYDTLSKGKERCVTAVFEWNGGK